MAGGEGAASPLRPGRAEAHVHPSMHDTVVGRTDTATITSGVSRLGSTVTNSGCTRAALGPSFSIAAATSLRVVEHTSEQDVQPKSTSRCLPRKSRSVTWLPSPSINVNGPPIRDGALAACPSPRRLSASKLAPTVNRINANLETRRALRTDAGMAQLIRHARPKAFVRCRRYLGLGFLEHPVWPVLDGWTPPISGRADARPRPLPVGEPPQDQVSDRAALRAAPCDPRPDGGQGVRHSATQELASGGRARKRTVATPASRGTVRGYQRDCSRRRSGPRSGSCCRPAVPPRAGALRGTAP